MSGLISGKPPLGYKFQAGFAVKDPETWDKVKKAWELMATGTKSGRDIAKIMSDWGLKEIHGKKAYQLRSQTVCRIFRLKFYAGFLTSKTYPDEIKGQHVPMITEEMFYKVQALLNGRGPNRGIFVKRTFINEDFPLRRLIKCGKCGAGMTGYWSTGRRGIKYAYYSCGMKCNYKCVPTKEVEESVIKLLKDITPKEETLKLFINSVYKAYHQRLSRLNKITSEADQEIEQLKLLRRSLVEKNLSGVYSDEIFKEQSAMIEDRITKAQISKEDEIISKYNIDALTSFTKTLLADLGETYTRSNISQLKVLLGSVFEGNLTWDYNGTPNTKISPLYQYIRAFSENHDPSGAGNDYLLGPKRSCNK